MQRRKSITSLTALLLITGSQAVNLQSTMTQIDGASNCEAQLADTHAEIQEITAQYASEIQADIYTMKEEIHNDIDDTKQRIQLEIDNLKQSIQNTFVYSNESFNNEVQSMVYEIDNTVQAAIADLEQAGCLGSSCSAPIEPSVDTQHESSDYYSSDPTQVINRSPIDELYKTIDPISEPVDTSEDSYDETAPETTSSDLTVELTEEEEFVDEALPTDTTEEDLVTPMLTPEVFEVDTGADEPTAYVVDNGPEEPETIFVDTAGVENPEVVITEPNDDSNPIIYVDGKEAMVIYVGDAEENPSVITINNGPEQDFSVYVVDSTDPEEPTVEQVLEPETELVPTDEPVPQHEDIIEEWSPVFDEQNNVSATEDITGTVTPLELVVEVGVIPVNDDQMPPSIETPEEIFVVDGGALEPTVYVVDNETEDPTYIVDTASDNTQPEIIIVENPDSEPTFIVDGVVAEVVDIGGEQESSVVVVVQNDQTSDPEVFVIDYTDPEQPVVQVIDEVEQETIEVEQLVVDRPETENLLVPTDEPVPESEDIIQEWSPVFDQDDNVLAIEDGNGTLTLLEPVVDVIVMPVDVDQEQPSVDTPEEVYVVDGGALEPTVYVVDNETAEPTYIVDPASENTQPEIIIIENPESEPTFIVDGVEAEVVDVGGAEQSPSVVVVIDEETSEPVVVVIDNSDPEQPVVQEIEEVEVQPETKTELVPTDEHVPEQEDIIQEWSPVFDQDDNVLAIEDGNGTLTLLEPVVDVIVMPVDVDQEKPSVDTPEEVFIVDGGALMPTVYVVDNETAEPTYIVDPASENTQPEILIIENPDSEPTFYVNGVEAEVVEIGGAEENPDVVVVINEETTETEVFVIDYSNPEEPVVNVIEEVEQITSEPVIELVPTDMPVPSEEEIIDEWFPIFDEGNVVGTGDDDSFEQLKLVKDVTVLPVEDYEEEPTVETPAEVYIVDGGALEPTVYVVDNETAEPTYIVDTASLNQEPTIFITENPNGEPTFTVDGLDADIVEIGGINQEPEVIVVINEETSERQVLVVDNTYPQQPVVNTIEEVEKEIIEPIVIETSTDETVDVYIPYVTEESDINILTPVYNDETNEIEQICTTADGCYVPEPLENVIVVIEEPVPTPEISEEQPCHEKLEEATATIESQDKEIAALEAEIAYLEAELAN